jgi:uncharacterized membrane protein
MIAILGGLGAAFAFATSTLCATRTSREIGAPSVVGWMMVVGLVATVPLVLLSGPVAIDGGLLPWLLLSGAGNIAGLVLEYHALRTGKVGTVAPIASTEGAIASVISVVAGEQLAPGVGLTLATIVIGVVLASAPGDDARVDRAPDDPRAGALTTGLLAIAAAVGFGVSLFATAQIGAALPVAWAVLPARLLGVLLIAAPLVLLRRLRITRGAAPLVVLAGLAEVVGFASFAIGSSGGVAISAVLASQFAALSAIGAYILFSERLTTRQLLGAGTIVAGVAALTVMQA